MQNFTEPNKISKIQSYYISVITVNAEATALCLLAITMITPTNQTSIPQTVMEEVNVMEGVNEVI